MLPFDQHKENAIISFLMSNQTMPHSVASKTLTGLGMECSSAYIYKLRLARNIPFNTKQETMKDKVVALKKAGKEITLDLLLAEFPDLNRQYALILIRQVNGYVPKVRRTEREVKTGVITKDGCVTVHRMF